MNGDPFSRARPNCANVLRSVALCTTAVPQLDVSVSTGVHDGEAAVKALLCGANAVQICSAIHEQGYGVIVDINRFIDLWAERHGFGALAEFRGKMNYGNAESDVYQRVQYMKYFPARRRIAARGTDLRRCGPGRPLRSPGRLFSGRSRRRGMRSGFFHSSGKNIFCGLRIRSRICVLNIGVVTAAPLNRPKLNKP